MKPDAIEAYYNRGEANAELEDFKAAIADFTEAINLKPDCADAYCKRGLAKLCLDKKSEAKVDFMRAIELGIRVSQNILDKCK